MLRRTSGPWPTTATCRSSSTTLEPAQACRSTCSSPRQYPARLRVKAASGSLEQIARICRHRPRDVAVLAGDDAWTLPILAMGGDGVVSVASNEIPGELVSLCAAASAGDWDRARRLHERWLPLFLANFVGAPNPVTVKAALALMGLIDHDATRLPLLPLDEPARAALATTLRQPAWWTSPAGDRAARSGAGMTASLAPARDGVAGLLRRCGRAACAPPEPMDAPDGWRVNASARRPSSMPSPIGRRPSGRRHSSSAIAPGCRSTWDRAAASSRAARRSAGAISSRASW
jgi:hypothetical protein